MNTQEAIEKANRHAAAAYAALCELADACDSQSTYIAQYDALKLLKAINRVEADLLETA